MDSHLGAEVLGVNSLADLDLKDLENRICQVNQPKLSRQGVLQTLMGWLHEQIKKDIQKSLLSDLVDLLLTGGKLQQEPFSQAEVEGAFKEWQLRDNVENPVNRRRYEMTRLDLDDLLKKARGDLSFDDDSAFMKSSKLSDIGELDDFSNDRLRPWLTGGRQKTGSNEIPLGKRKVPRDNIQENIVDTEGQKNQEAFESSARGMSPIKRTPEQALSDMSLRGPSPARTFGSDWQDPSKVDHRFSRPPQDTYTCNRCHRSGHWVQLCPTNLDPSYDSAPPSDYECGLCGRFGVHYATLCPRNKNETSLTQQRKFHKAQLRTPARDYGSRYRDRRSPTPPPRYRSRSPTDRRRVKRRDNYRPDDGLQGWVRITGKSPHRSSDRGSVSPWTARERKTRELHRRDASPLAYTSYAYHPRNRSPSPPPSRRASYRARALSPEGHSRRLIELSDTEKERNGRLAYNNDEFFMNWNGSPTTPSSPQKKERVGSNVSEDVVMTDAPWVVKDTPEMEQAMKEADEFLDRLATELGLQNGTIRSTESGLTLNQGISNYAAMGRANANQDSRIRERILASPKTTSEVDQGKLGPETLALIESGQNPMIHHKAKRTTARDMIERTGLCKPSGTPQRPEQHRY